MKKPTYILGAVIGLGLVGWWIAQSGLLMPKPRVIAMAHYTDVDVRTAAGFKDGLAEAGFREGKEVVFVTRPPAGKIELLDGLVRELLAKKPDLIMVSTTPGTLAVKKATQGTSIPVVFAPVNDPIAAGIVANLQRPGGNITGIRLPRDDDRRLKWLKDVAPGTKRVFVPFTPGDSSSQTSRDHIASVAAALGVELVMQEAKGKEGIEAALATLAAHPGKADAIFLPRDTNIEANLDTFVKFAEAHRMPLCAPGSAQVDKGALMSYGFVPHYDIGRHAARLASQILKGVPPGDVPVETAESILSINLASAQRSGLTISDEILRQAQKIVRE